tara:strand:- start:39 stop:359 length:321 start_codon:yes stop_codon:yes gene_type:complete
MKKIIIVITVFFLIIVTTITKNSTKNLESKIFTAKENISVLQEQYELIVLDFNFLSTPQKLLEYQAKYFENELSPIDINEIKEIDLSTDKVKISNLNKKIIENEKK